jgi:hypothetical protein
VSGAETERAHRLAFAVPPVTDAPEWIEPDLLDADDPDGRALLIRAAHPEMYSEAARRAPT